LLSEHRCLFGGGTCIALRYGEYGESVNIVLRDLAKAIDRMQNRQGWMERCMQVMAMEAPKAVLWKKVRALRRVMA
jgi:hypothetical protein